MSLYKALYEPQNVWAPPLVDSHGPKPCDIEVQRAERKRSPESGRELPTPQRGNKNVNFLHVAKEARKRDHSGNPSADEITEADSCIAST